MAWVLPQELHLGVLLIMIILSNQCMPDTRGAFYIFTALIFKHMTQLLSIPTLEMRQLMPTEAK